MKYFGEGLSEKHKELSSIIRKLDKIEQAKELFLDIHANLHLSVISNGIENEVDTLIRDLVEPEYAIMPTSKDETIAWVIWHIARIEDLTMGILLDGGGQLFNEKWKKKMNSTITDTGNALTDEEIIELSKSLSISELLQYRNEVGKRTKMIVKGLSSDDMKRKVSPKGLEKNLTGRWRYDSGRFYLVT